MRSGPGVSSERGILRHGFDRDFKNLIQADRASLTQPNEAYGLCVPESEFPKWEKLATLRGGLTRRLFAMLLCITMI